jgi:hypothetical protein
MSSKRTQHQMKPCERRSGGCGLEDSQLFIELFKWTLLSPYQVVPRGHNAQKLDATVHKRR